MWETSLYPGEKKKTQKSEAESRLLVGEIILVLLRFKPKSPLKNKKGKKKKQNKKKVGDPKLGSSVSFRSKIKTQGSALIMVEHQLGSFELVGFKLFLANETAEKSAKMRAYLTLDETPKEVLLHSSLNFFKGIVYL